MLIITFANNRVAKKPGIIKKNLKVVNAANKNQENLKFEKKIEF